MLVEAEVVLVEAEVVCNRLVSGKGGVCCDVLW